MTGKNLEYISITVESWESNSPIYGELIYHCDTNVDQIVVDRNNYSIIGVWKAGYKYVKYELRLLSHTIMNNQLQVNYVSSYEIISIKLWLKCKKK